MNYQKLYTHLSRDTVWTNWLEILPAQLDQFLNAANNGNFPRWRSAFEELPDIQASQQALNQSHVSAGRKSDCNEPTHEILLKNLQALKPWRKGPYQLFDITIDSEWRSDWKWNRLIQHISPLKHKTVLDVGCGNGYHSWRMAGCGAELVIGIDPSLLFVMQFQAINKYLCNDNVFVLPLRLEDMPSPLPAFDSIFSMGVLYHRRSPIDHLFELRNLLKPGGEIILETLIVSGNEKTVLVPKQRYAQMKNVWFLPSADSMINWLEKCGFKNARVVDINQTSLEEQRTTPWMPYNSLVDFLDPNDNNLTLEGYPAPTRAIFIANISS
ncbi:MAG TPA: tRNA 5-methoxyuridine(34)/uridine 5-oxyacetic acid(34) synthase CmoB [Gammaproteobacteria bacterium]|nr:tRNA 5-methoxyuridine(34)/uridine 5-oxyacetic acid(34) synthase CmoB [Gammaproteobacteria bacterium]